MIIYFITRAESEILRVRDHYTILRARRVEHLKIGLNLAKHFRSSVARYRCAILFSFRSESNFTMHYIVNIAFIYKDTTFSLAINKV